MKHVNEEGRKTPRGPIRQLRLLWQFMRGKRMLYLGSLLAVGMATVFCLTAPLVLRTTIDSIIGDNPLSQTHAWLNQVIEATGGKRALAQRLWMCSLALVALSAAEGVFLFLKGKWAAMAAEATAQQIRDRLYDHLQHLSYDYHVKAETGDLIQRCTSDVDTIRQFLAMQLVEVGRAVFMITFVIPVMLSVDTRMTLVAMALIPAIFGFVAFFFVKVKRAFRASDEAEARMSTVLHENLSGVRVVRAFAQQLYEIEKFDRTNAGYRDVTYTLIRLFALYWCVSSLLGMAQFGVVLLCGAYWAAKGAITLGTLVVFISYIERLIHSICQLGTVAGVAAIESGLRAANAAPVQRHAAGEHPLCPAGGDR